MQSNHSFLGRAILAALLLLFVATGAMAQSANEKLSGRVLDSDGNPVVGAIVKSRSGKSSAVTDADGNFTIKADGNTVIIEVSYLGMKTATWKGKPTQTAKVTLVDDNQMLDDVVVTGYQQLDRRNLTSSVVSKDMSELEIKGVSDLSKMLEGKIPDLVTMTNSGEVNATNKIRIRGTSTLVGNREPLWVLDGIILTDAVNLSSDVLNDPDYVNRIGNAIAGINPQDIQRIDVLKDAAATALYGTRAANGVIVITTKSGREGKPMVSYSLQTTFRKRPYYSDGKINLMNSAERMQFSQQLAEMHFAYPSNMAKVGYEEALRQLYSGEINREEFNALIKQMSAENTDWFDILCHNTLSQDHSLSVSGGAEKVRYYTSLGFTDQNDVVKGSLNRRYTAMAKINYDITSKLKAEFNFNGNVNDREYSASDINPINYAYKISRTIPCFNEDGSYYKYLKHVYNDAGSDDLGYNILNDMDNSYTKQNTNAAIATASLRYQPTDEIFINGVFSANVSNAQIKEYHGEKSWMMTSARMCEAGKTPSNSSLAPFGGQLDRKHNGTIGWTGRVQGNYNHYFDKDKHHNMNVALGFEASSSHYTGDSYVQRGYYPERGETFVQDIDAKYENYWAWVRRHVPSITDTKSNMLSVYATLSYSYKNLFTVNANGRYDGSNKFGSRSNEKLLPIWSVSGNANLMDIFKIDLPWLEMLTLKSSYGEQGNMLDNQSPQLIIKKGSYDTFYESFISTAAYFANPDLRWEKTHSFNVGLQTSVLRNRLQFEAEYYRKRTTDAFMNKTISDINGYTSYVVNSGEITNSGFNFTVTATPIKTKDFYWIISGNLSKIYNKVKTLPGTESYFLNDFLNGTAIVQGMPVGTFYSYRFAGLSPVNGGPLFDDGEEHQNELANLNQYDFYTTVLEATGRREPNVTGSLSNTLTYKQWRLTTSLLFNFGANTRLFRLFDGYTQGRMFASDENANRDLMNRWMMPGDEQTTIIPAIIGGGEANTMNHYTSNWTNNVGWSGPKLHDNAWTQFDYCNARVVSADYVKLSNIALTYELKQNQLDKIGLNRLAITLSGYNLHTWCDKRLRGQTPTQGGFSEVQLSDMPTFTLSLNVNF